MYLALKNVKMTVKYLKLLWYTPFLFIFELFLSCLILILTTEL